MADNRTDYLVDDDIFKKALGDTSDTPASTAQPDAATGSNNKKSSWDKDYIDDFFERLDEMIKINEKFDEIVFDRKQVPKDVSRQLTQKHIRATRKIRKIYHELKKEYDDLHPSKIKIMLGTASREEIARYSVKIREFVEKVRDHIIHLSAEKRCSWGLEYNYERIRNFENRPANIFGFEFAGILCTYWREINDLKDEVCEFYDNFVADDYVSFLQNSSKEP